MELVDQEGGEAVDVSCKAIEGDVDDVFVDGASMERVNNNKTFNLTPVFFFVSHLRCSHTCIFSFQNMTLSLLLTAEIASSSAVL